MALVDIVIDTIKERRDKACDACEHYLEVHSHDQYCWWDGYKRACNELINELEEQKKLFS